MTNAAEEYYGGGWSFQLPGSSIHNLAQDRRWFHSVGSGGSGDLTVILPYAKGLKLGQFWTGSFEHSPSIDIVFKTYDNVTQSVYDMNGNIKTKIDISDVANWGSYPVVRARLINNSTDAGIWTVYYLGDGTV